MFQKRLKFFRSILYLGDLCLVLVCWVGAYLVRFYYPILPITKGVPDLWLYLWLMLLMLGSTPWSSRPWACTANPGRA